MSDAANPQEIFRKDYTPPTHLIEKTHLVFELGEEDTRVSSRLSVRRNPAAQGLVVEETDSLSSSTLSVKNASTDLSLDKGKAVEISAVRIDGKTLKEGTDYTVEEEKLIIHNAPESFTLEIENSISPSANTSLNGLYKSGEKLCTQCESEGFRNITPFLDRPDVLSEYTVTLIADGDKYKTLLSNGNEVERKKREDGRTEVVWHDPFPKPTYLFALVAGDLDVLQDKYTTMSGREVDLFLFVDKGDLDKADFAMGAIKRSMEWDEKRFGREYDLDRFMVVAVDDFNFGAMENKGLNIFNSKYVLGNPDIATDGDFFNIEAIIGHEYFHNWSGDRVTCRNWFELSLKEGFTVFRDQEFSADLHSRAIQRIEDAAAIRSHQFAEDAGPMAHPIRPASYVSINNFYTTTVYQKGAEVIRMMHTMLGEEAFRAGSDLYFDRHDGQAVTTEDFVRAMQDASGIDLSQFERTWYNQAGTPKLEITDEYDEATKTYKLHVKQSCPPTPGQEEKEPFHIPLRAGLLDRRGNDIPLNVSEKGALTAGDVLNVTQEEQTFTFTNVEQKPIPSLLRNFSAPVKLEYDYSKADLAYLARHDSDTFNRWDAGQRLGLAAIQEQYDAMVAGSTALPKVDEDIIEAIRAVLLDDSVDKAFKAEFMKLPSQKYMMELQDGSVDPVKMYEARERVANAVAEALQDIMLSGYKENLSSEPYHFSSGAMAQRSLKNGSLDYLLRVQSRDFSALATEQYEKADNMTDISPALTGLIDVGGRNAAVAGKVSLYMDAFYEEWKKDPLMLDRCFSMQAADRSEGALERVQELLEHPDFNIKNPNRARAVIGGFVANTPHFHKEDGSGYQFLADQVIALDAINPQKAAGFVGALIEWKKYDPLRQELMQEQLQRIMDTNPSKDVYEKVSKSLAQAAEKKPGNGVSEVGDISQPLPQQEQDKGFGT